MAKKVMMIADDVEMNVTVIKRFFSKDFDVLVASNGLEVMRLLKAQKVDILILDIIMPEMNGIEVLQEMHNHSEYSDIAVFVATSTKEKTERMALEYGADDIVSKPYDPVVIKRRIENIMTKKELQRKVNAMEQIIDSLQETVDKMREII